MISENCPYFEIVDVTRSEVILSVIKHVLKWALCVDILPYKTTLTKMLFQFKVLLTPSNKDHCYGHVQPPWS